jgi:MFS family permease
LTALKIAAGRTFRSLRIRNYRLYFISQIISFCGAWMQSVALMWLVLSLTGSGLALGLTSGLQLTPLLLIGAWGGVIADRFDKRRILIVTQVLASSVALALWALTFSNNIDLWMIYTLALLHGCVIAVDNPTRQSFAFEMVGSDELANAVGLNSVIIVSARTIGPALAGVLIATSGVAVCFLLNALSYIAVIVGLLAIRVTELHRSAPVARTRGQLRAGLRYAWSTPAVRLPLLMMAVIGTLAFNFRVILPLMAHDVFHGGAQTLGILSAVMGVGTIGGALAAASRRRPTRRMLLGSALAFGVLTLTAAAAPNLGLELAALIPTGAASIFFAATCNATLQLNSDGAMRGRVMALYAVVFLGSTPIGGPIAGVVAEQLGPRAAFALGGIAAIAAALVALRARIRTEVRDTAVAFRMLRGDGLPGFDGAPLRLDARSSFVGDARPPAGLARFFAPSRQAASGARPDRDQ